MNYAKGLAWWTHVSVDWTGQKRVSLAMQGGGSHCAFTWGMLDYLLEVGRLDIEAITGTSAGAMNAVAWPRAFSKTAARARASASPNSGLAVVVDGHATVDPFSHPFCKPLRLQPAKHQSLARSSRKDGRFRQDAGLDRAQIIYRGYQRPNRQDQDFRSPELAADHVMASACLPYLFQAVEIDDVPYWDGGYMGNPALFPLFYKTACPDIVIVQINPIERDEVPRSAHEIQDRLNEITFNRALLGELQAIDFVTGSSIRGNCRATIICGLRA